MIDLEKFKPQPTRYKKIFKDHGITVAVIARYLNRTSSYISNILNGNIPMPVKMEGKLQELIDQLETKENGDSTMIDIEAYKPKHSGFKKIFKAHGINIATIANYLDRSYPHVLNVLSGYYRMTPEIREKLQKLVDQLEGA